MAVFLGPHTSLMYWRSHDPYVGESLNINRLVDAGFDACASTMSQIERINLWGLWSSESKRPLDIVVPKASMRSNSNRLSYTVLDRPLPQKTFCGAYKDVRVCSPELVFMLYAPKLEFLPLLLLAHELCGNYSRTDESEGFFIHEPLSSRDDLLSFMAQFERFKGLRLAKDVVAHTTDNTRSPSESQLSILLSLPTRLGGFGFGGVKANQTLSVPEKLRTQTDLKLITPDLYWPDKKLAVEYESTAYHGAASRSSDPTVRMRANRIQLAKDSKRRRTYDAMGINVQTVTAAELSDFNEMYRIASVLGRHLGKHGLDRSLKTLRRREDLHQWLKYAYYKRKNTSNYSSSPEKYVV